MPTPFRVAILTVSDRTSRGEQEDASGPLLADLVAHSLEAEVIARAVVPDERPAIQAALLPWCQPGAADLILTTGGTGFAPRDITPEAVRPLLDREAPGLVVAMLQASLAVTPHAMLSRPVAGIRGRTLIITLPGSPKACREIFATLAPALPHGLALLRDDPDAPQGHRILRA